MIAKKLQKYLTKRRGIIPFVYTVFVYLNKLRFCKASLTRFRLMIKYFSIVEIEDIIFLYDYNSNLIYIFEIEFVIESLNLSVSLQSILYTILVWSIFHRPPLSTKTNTINQTSPHR